MKNAFFVLLLTAGITSFFSFTNTKQRLITEQAEDEDDADDGETYIMDTVPHKKDSSKMRPKTVPYDSFGKPKTMDSLTSN